MLPFQKVNRVVCVQNVATLKTHAMTGNEDVATKRLLYTRKAFSRSPMLSISVSQLRYTTTSLIFVDHRVKVDEANYYCHSLRQVSGELFVFQQDGATAHCRAREPIGIPER